MPLQGPNRPEKSILPGLLPIFLLLLSSCGTETRSTIRTETRDSAGVTIVESSGLPERGSGGWTLGQNPELSIGMLEGDTLYQLFRVTNGIFLSDGRIAISENGRLQLRVFGPDGSFLQGLGREGEGPGEFEFVVIVGALGTDTLVALDGSQRRISRFHLTEGFLDQATIAEEAGIAHFFNGMFSDGSVVFGGGLNFGPGGATPNDGYQRPTAEFRSVTPDGRIDTDFGDFPGTEIFFKTQGGGGEMMISASVIHFGKTVRTHTRGSRFVLGTGDSFEVDFFGPEGRLERLVRVMAPPIPVTQEMLDGLLEERLAALDDPTRAPATRSSFDEIPAADFVPAYRNLFLDSEGFLWVEHYRLPGNGLSTWTIFDPDGVPVTELSLPRQNRILDIGPGKVLALFEDDLGVEYLRVYPLTRGR